MKEFKYKVIEIKDGKITIEFPDAKLIKTFDVRYVPTEDKMEFEKWVIAYVEAYTQGKAQEDSQSSVDTTVSSNIGKVTIIQKE